MKKISFIIALLCSFTINAQDVSGVWVFESIRYENDSLKKDLKPISSTDLLRINDDSTFEYTLARIKYKANGKWVKEDNSIIFSYKHPRDTVREYNIIINDTIFILNEDGINYSFRKAGIDTKIDKAFQPISDFFSKIK